MNLEEKINKVKNALKDKKVLLAYSSGSDSTLLAHISSKVAEKTLLVTIDNGLFASDFIENVKSSTDNLKVEHEIININFHENKKILENRSDRCYICRQLMYEKIKEIAQNKGYDYIIDGNNLSDLTLDRPGILITYDNDFKTPLMDAGLTSKDIHEYLEKNNIPYHRNTTCLATRLKTNTPITSDQIELTDRCEKIVKEATDCQIVKVRNLDTSAIVEVDNISKITSDNKYKEINDKLKSEGYKKVLLNLTQLEDTEEIVLDYEGGNFKYQLPYTINIEKTIKNIKYIQYDEEKIKTEHTTIRKDGLIEGHDYKNYSQAYNDFTNILRKIRRIR
ncbi:MAG: TIGR00268 family protein [Methanosphaera sp.]|nr:TIGR00268 family protein [Methanosphaera sp.]